MDYAQHNQPSIHDYIRHQRQTGVPDQTIYSQLVQAGWDTNQASQLLTAGVPQPPVTLPTYQYAQTGNTGMPVQMENVQYNMNIKPVESKVGLYLRIAMLGLWVSVATACILLATIIDKTMNEAYADLGMDFVVAISVWCVSLPVFLIANQKRHASMAKDPRLVDDLFFKKRVRRSLRFALILTGLATVATVFNLLSTLFLKNDDANMAGFLSSLCFALGFGGILAFVWSLHSKTQR